MKIFWKICIALIIVFLVLSCAGVIISCVFKDEVSEVLVRELNKKINTQIDVRQVKFSVWRKFPNASLAFKDVLVHPTSTIPGIGQTSNTNSDTLLSARNLFLEFSIIDILKKKYEVKRIHADRGSLYLFVDRKGSSNFKILKSEKNTTNSGTKIKLQDLKFTNLDFHIINHVSQFVFIGFAETFELKGNFSSREFDLHSGSRMYIENLSLDKVRYITQKNGRIDLGIQVRDSQYTIDNGFLDIAGLKFNVGGSFSTGEEKNLNLSVKGNDLDLPSMIFLLPEVYRKNFRNFHTLGDLNFDLTLTGGYGIQGPPHVVTTFELDEAMIHPFKSDIRMTGLNMTGTYSNGRENHLRSSSLKIIDFFCNIGESELSGSGQLYNFEKPVLELLLKGDLDLSELHQFFQPNAIDYMAGQIRLNLKLDGNLLNFNRITRKDIESLNPVGQASLKNVTLELKDDPKIFSDINGSLMFEKHIWVDGVTFDMGGNSFFMEGKLGNAIPYILSGSKPLLIDAFVRSEEIVPNRFIFSAETTVDTLTAINIIFPENIQMILRLEIGQFNHHDFTASNLTGVLSYKPTRMSLQSVEFESMEGRASGDGLIVQNIDSGFTVRLHSDLEQINIKELFKSFNNFGQEFISEENLNGKINGKIDFTADWNRDLKVNKSSIISENQLRITNGELISFEPILRLSRFIEVSELNHIKFSTLENEILIKDEKITIPQMDIQSSALNITLSGVHDFNNNFTYKTKVLLSDFLFSKAKQAKKENEEFGIVEDDGFGRTSLYLTITGTPGDISVTYDRRQVREAISENFQEERRELKKILQEEFGWFKKDSINRIAEENTNKEFLIEWDDTDTTKAAENDSLETRKKFRIEWEDKEETQDTTKTKKKRQGAIN